MEEEHQESSSDSSNRIYTLKSCCSVLLVRVTMELDSNPIFLEVDTGAAYSFISESTYRELWPSRSLSKADVRLLDSPPQYWEASQWLSVTNIITPRSHS